MVRVVVGFVALSMAMVTPLCAARMVLGGIVTMLAEGRKHLSPGSPPPSNA